VGIVRSHIIDSLFVAPLVQPGFRVADIGSGAGFPGLPLAIACEATLSLIEANRKKANFLREVVRRARLSNVEVIEERAEHLATTRAEAYQLVVSRALWRVPQFLRASQPLLRSGGLAVAMKGPRGSEEAGCRWPSFSEPEVMPYQLKGNVRRMLLVYRKIDPRAVR